MDDRISQTIAAAAIAAEAADIFSRPQTVKHAEVFQEILDTLEPVNFALLAGIESGKEPNQIHLRVLTIREVLRVAKELNCGLCRNQDFIYAYNGECWRIVEREKLESFLGAAAAKIGVNGITAEDCEFRAKLFKQFMSTAYLPKPETGSETVLINLQNGTAEINNGRFTMREFRREDFLTYQLPFKYEPEAECPRFENFLNEVLPDESKRKVLAEYFGYVFAKHLKLEKTLILYGGGANGKSVIADIMNALFGKENISNFSLESLGENYFRAMIANKLLNYSSEISNRLQAEKFKQLTSGEPVEARLPYGQPMTLTNYARLAFNCNELPKDVEHSEAFFRRFLIIPFDVTIPAAKRNPLLAKEIIQNELSGVFNWILSGLQRLLAQNKFSDCPAVEKMLDTYRRESDSAAMFLDDEGYKKSNDDWSEVKNIYQNYRAYCLDNGYKPLGRNNFSKRLESNGVLVERKNVGLVAYLRREVY